MLNQESISNLHEVLLACINKCEDDIEIKREFLAHIKNRINIGKVSKLLNGNMPLEMFGEKEDLFYLTKSFYDTFLKLQNEGKKGFTKYIKNVELSNFFTDNEITDYSNALPNVDNIGNKNKIILQNMRKIVNRDGSCEFIGLITYKEISNNINNGLLTYNLRTQRKATAKKLMNGTVTKIPTIKMKAVKSIKNLMKKNLYERNTVILNILKSDYDNYNFNEDNGTLEISVSDKTPVDIIDGGHRATAIVHLLNEEQDYEETMYVRIVNYGIEKARNVIWQEAQHNEDDKLHIKSYNMNDLGINVVNNINTKAPADSNGLFGKITDEKKNVIYGKAYVDKITFSEAIKFSFEDELKNLLEQKKIPKFIIDVMNYIIGSFQEEFENIKQSKKKYVTTNGNAFPFYIGIARELYNYDNWEDYILDILDSINFSNENEVWKELKVNGNIQLAERQIKKICNYGMNLTKEIITEKENKGGEIDD